MTPKGFGAPRHIEIVRLEEASKTEFDRAKNAYLRQGLSAEKALELVSVSCHYFLAAEAGFVVGEDILYDPIQDDGKGGLLLSEPLAEHMRSWDPRRWDYFRAEEVVQQVKPKPGMALTKEGFAKSCLHTLRDPSGTVDGGAKTRAVLVEMLTIAGLTEADANIRLDEWIAGDDSLLNEVEDLCRRMQENLQGEES